MLEMIYGGGLRVSEVVALCPACGGTVKIIAALTAGVSVFRYLEGVGLPSRAPPISCAHRPTTGI